MKSLKDLNSSSQLGNNRADRLIKFQYIYIYASLRLFFLSTQIPSTKIIVAVELNFLHKDAHAIH